MKKQNWIALLLAGGKGTRLNLLTKTLVKPAVPFGGKYRIIDFALSNCQNSGIETVGILTQYKPYVLHAHLGQYSYWNLYNQNGGLTILPPYQRSNSGVEWYEGTSHAVYQNIEFIEQNNPDYVAILSADQIYKMDYSVMLEQHIETKADCTIAVVEVPWEEASRFGLINIDRQTYKIIDFKEKPNRPSSNLASMGIYIFTWKILKDYLQLEEQKECTNRDFGKDIIPSMLSDGLQLYAYYFDQYWRDVGTVHSYWEANLDLLKGENNIFLQNPKWQIHTVEHHEPPLFLAESAKIHQSLISEGCEVYGSIEDSVLCNGVKVGKGARIKNAVILPHTTIEENAWIENAVVGSQSLIKNGVIIVSKNPDENLMVVGNNETVDPTIQDDLTPNHVISVTS
ncbi:glucose-1-phosphate adenylyltransferase [Neobacillus sp. MM2021_6]|uniref:glucose-1-phosphate adenylyltransferase n=1 Tax=Bacillaceae TaxID=186817 RepID=UPI00140AAC56|nr:MULTISPECIES: glucose-1-phosphate adenylyltransferase [Bacillaceae]MBO0962247.1 glucose-1-phosphate adenylyltransferase [Neobacillus sp. MM2021_6]NHC18261.1 glucose-1-phosphate adenylyltransferase [Bacillus sp. MM2020_4]